MSDTPQIVTRVPTLTPRPVDMHKGQAGRVSIIAGSTGMSGAAVLCGLAALRGGAGLVRVLCPAPAQPIIAAAEPSLMTRPLPADAAGHLAGPTPDGAFDDADVLAVGPGLGRAAGVSAAVAAAWHTFAGPLVLDADGLNALAAGDAAVWGTRRGRPTILTPHPGELARIRASLGQPGDDGPGDDARVVAARGVATATGAVVVHKGHRTVVTDGPRVYINTTGNPGMATGGMGDVLTGLIAALVGQGLAPFDAACLGVHVHGAAADHLAGRRGPFGYLAREVADTLPGVLRHHIGV